MAFNETNHNSATLESEQEITLGILKHVASDNNMTQRSAATEMGIALGVVNFYLKKCIKKGWIKIAHAPANRYLYYLTPKGLAEKSKLTQEYLAQSFNFFRYAREQCAAILEECSEQGLKRIVLYGTGDLADIIGLYAKEYPVKLLAIVEVNGGVDKNARPPIVASINDVRRFDVIILTDLNNPQNSYDILAEQYSKDRIVVPGLLDVSLDPLVLAE